MEGGVLVYLLVCTIGQLLFTAWLLREFAHKQVTMDIRLLVYISWNLSLAVVFVVPLDLWPSIEEKRSLTGFYQFLYWSSFLLTWLVLPLVQGYKSSGSFTSKERLIDSIKLNGIFYIISVILILIGFIYLLIVTNLKSSTLLALLQSLANLWGLCLAILALGYGLVEVPRRMFYQSNLSARLDYYAWKLFILQHDLEEAVDRVNEAIYLYSYVCRKSSNINDISNDSLSSVNNNSNNNNSDTNRRRYATVFANELEIIRQCAVMYGIDLDNKKSLSIRDLDTHRSEKRQSIMDIIDNGELSRSELAFIKAELNRWGFQMQRTQTLIDYSAKNAIYFESLAEQRAREDIMGVGIGSDSPHSSSIDGSINTNTISNDNVWNKVYRPWLWKVTSVILAVMSVLIVWSELTLSFDSGLSILALITNNGKTSNFGVVFAGCLFLLYICVCALYALWTLRIGHFYQMHNHHLTDNDSLLLNAAFALRLTFPLAFNFFYLCKAKNESEYAGMFKDMNQLPVLGHPVNTILPLTVTLFCLCTWLNLYGRMLKLLRLSRFEYSDSTSAGNKQRRSEEINHQIKSGLMLLSKYKRTHPNCVFGDSYGDNLIAVGGNSGMPSSWMSRFWSLLTGNVMMNHSDVYRDERALVPDDDDAQLNLESINL